MQGDQIDQIIDLTTLQIRFRVQSHIGDEYLESDQPKYLYNAYHLYSNWIGVDVKSAHQKENI